VPEATYPLALKEGWSTKDGIGGANSTQLPVLRTAPVGLPLSLEPRRLRRNPRLILETLLHGTSTIDLPRLFEISVPVLGTFAGAFVTAISKSALGLVAAAI
jgi:hypothetical protein